MFTTYILINDRSKRHYIGHTNNLERRLSEHNRGHTKSTNQKGQWILLYREEYNTNKEAEARERTIKSYKGGNAFKKLICGCSSPVE